MKSTARPRSLSEAITERLRADIMEGKIAAKIPGENCLAREYSVARTTIRTALKKLEGEGVVTPTSQGKSRTTVQSFPRKKSNQVRILTPEKLEELDNCSRAYVQAMLHEIAAAGISVKICPKCYSIINCGVEKQLQSIVEEFSADCWILVTPSKEVGNWFIDNQVPCVAYGGDPVEGLTRIYHDGAAVLRHAFHMFFRNGHQQILTATRWHRTERYRLVGEIFAASRVPFSLKKNVLCYQNDPNLLREGLLVHLKKSAKTRPTALVLPNSQGVGVLYSVLVELGLRIPHDLSLVVFNGDRMIQSFFPRPCSYSANVEELNRAMVKSVFQKLHQPLTPLEDQLLMMDFQGGGSLKNLSEEDTS